MEGEEEEEKNTYITGPLNSPFFAEGNEFPKKTRSQRGAPNVSKSNTTALLSLKDKMPTLVKIRFWESVGIFHAYLP